MIKLPNKNYLRESFSVRLFQRENRTILHAGIVTSKNKAFRIKQLEFQFLILIGDELSMATFYFLDIFTTKPHHVCCMIKITTNERRKEILSDFSFLWDEIYYQYSMILIHVLSGIMLIHCSRKFRFELSTKNFSVYFWMTQKTFSGR